jgi:hypothetical protein
MSRPTSQTVSQAPPSGPTIRVQSSRLWTLSKGRFTNFLFPSHLSADRLGITLVNSISIESSGGLNPLQVEGLPKGAATRFVDQVRSWMNG